MKILIIEDEHRIATSLKKGLEQERYIIDMVFDGEEGYDFASSGDYDLILLDRMLPNKDGIEICKKLRKNGFHTPILMLTAKDQTQDKVDGLNSGADDYLVKPFAFEELLARIKALLRRPHESNIEVLKVGDLVLNTTTFEVMRGGKRIKLSQKEYAVLEYLMRKNNTIVSKNDIITHVWDYDSDILINTVEVFIKQLRNKIDRAFTQKNPLIQTIRGFGYKISDNP
jgi:DNA-binding response OmpR family regulator